MTTMQRFKAGATPRGTPATRRGLTRRPAILLLLATLSLFETGCQSGFFGPCGSCRNGLRAFGERVFRPFRTRTVVTQPCCGDSVPLGVESAGPLQYGTPAVVAPAPITSIPSTTITTPAPSTTITTPAPSSLDSLPSTLDPIPPAPEARPSASPGPPPAANGNGSSIREGARSNTGRANYEAYRPPFPDEPVRSTRLDPVKSKGPESTNRSTQGPARSVGVDESSLLDNLPPLDIPKELSRAKTDGAARATAERPEPASPSPTIFPEVGPTTLAGLPAQPAPMAVAPGIRRFAGVSSKLSGGSAPDAGGLDWLAEKGYKTILDLREENEISPTFISNVARRGMRYVALPITLKTLDSEHLKRFRFEISLADSRPLYFFDNDGNRAGALWYIHRITADGVDPQVARRDAEELGLSDPRFLEAAGVFLESTRPAPAPALVPEEAKPVPAPASNPAGTPADKEKTGNKAPATRSADASRPGPITWDAMSWKSLLPLLVTILGFPVALISRSALSFRGFRRAARASLTGPSRSRKSLPSSSGG